MQRFLTFVVESRLTSKFHSEDLKESVIGMAVFDREADYDPKNDPVVRVEARRLRTKLEEYYDGSGKRDPLRILLPKGSYVPSWEWQAVADSPLPQPPSGTPAKRWWLPALAAAAILIGLAIFFGASTWKGYLEGRGAPNTSKIRSLAILPFRNLSGDPSKEYLAGGLNGRTHYRASQDSRPEGNFPHLCGPVSSDQQASAGNRPRTQCRWCCGGNSPQFSWLYPRQCAADSSSHGQSLVGRELRTEW